VRESQTEPRSTDVACMDGAPELRLLGRQRHRASTHSDVDEILGGREGRGSTALGSRSCKWDQRESDRLREEGGSARDLGRAGGARLDGAWVAEV
jgi:hypothetical protein